MRNTTTTVVIAAGVVLAAVAATQAATIHVDVANCPGPGDGSVGIVDFLLLLAAWGPCNVPCPPSCPADLDDDCVVGIMDFLLLLGNWG